MSDILIIDNDDSIREALHRILDGAGYQTRLAETAEQAVLCVGNACPAVVFCDARMPGAEGLRLSEQVAALSPATAVIVSSTDAAVRSAEPLLEKIATYLQRPFEQAQVLLAASEGIRRWTERTSAGGAPAGAPQRQEQPGNAAAAGPADREPEDLHSLKNQLGIIAGFADLLLLEVDPEHPHHTYLVEVRGAATKALALAPRVAGRS
jgi:DNA-binding NtrC family response regulator